jgi:hypothetical protein
MDVLKHITNATEVVRRYLIKFPHLRDDDFKLIASVWAEQLGGKERLKSMSAFDFVQLFSEGKLSSPESIRRSRQKLQEDTLELRGLKYNERKKQEQIIKNQINSI